MIVVTEKGTGRQWRFPSAEAFEAAASSPARPWSGLVVVRPLELVEDEDVAS